MKRVGVSSEASSGCIPARPSRAQDDSGYCCRTVPELQSLTGLELSLERKQMPQVVENVENECSGCNRWKERLFAQGRCATRLRHAPTGIPQYFGALVNGRRMTVPELPQNVDCTKTSCRHELSESLGFRETRIRSWPLSCPTTCAKSRCARILIRGASGQGRTVRP
jgi:hypothetical protein